jgi:hypothetical protein
MNVWEKKARKKGDRTERKDALPPPNEDDRVCGDDEDDDDGDRVRGDLLIHAGRAQASKKILQSKTVFPFVIKFPLHFWVPPKPAVPPPSIIWTFIHFIDHGGSLLFPAPSARHLSHSFVSYHLGIVLTLCPFFVLPVFAQRVVPRIMREEEGAGEEKGEHARLVFIASYHHRISRLYRSDDMCDAMWCLLCDRSFVSLGVSLQSSFVGAIAVADLVKTTLGPKGMVINDIIIHYDMGTKPALIVPLCLAMRGLNDWSINQSINRWWCGRIKSFNQSVATVKVWTKSPSLMMARLFSNLFPLTILLQKLSLVAAFGSTLLLVSSSSPRSPWLLSCYCLLLGDRHL